MRVAPVEQRRKKYLILPRWTGAAGSPLCYCYWHVCDSHIYATRETERFPIFPKDPASKTPLPEFSGLRMRDRHMLRISGRVAAARGRRWGVPAVGRSWDQHLWAGGAKWCVADMFPRNRRMLRVGCPR